MLDTVLDLLKKSEADAWEATDEKIEGWEFYFIRHNLDQNRAKNVEHINVTVYKKIEDGKYLGKASAEINPSESAEEVEKQIRGLVYNASLVRNNAYTLNRPQEAEVMEAADFNVADVAKDFITVMNEMPETESEDLNSYEIFAEKVTTRFVNSEGIDIQGTYPKSMLEAVMNARNSEHEIELYRLYRSGTCDREGLKKDISRTLQYGKDRLRTVSTPSLGKCDVVFSTSDAKTIFNYFLYRLNAQYVYRKMSDWKIGTVIDDSIEGDRVTIDTKRFLENSSVNFAYDGEGAPIRDLTIMKDGTPCAYWGDRMSSCYLNLENSFNISNYEVSGGTKSEEEIRSGRYLEVVEFSDFQVSPVSGDIFGEIRLGYLHDGDTVTPVSGGSVSGNMRDYLKKMYMSLESAQYNNARIPSVTKLCDVTVTGAE